MKVLFCILNWGLGHATRSSVLINEYLKEGKKIEIASDGNALIFLKSLYPQLTFHTLPGYNVYYPKYGMPYSLVFQIPKIQKVIKQEQQVIGKIVKNYNPDIIISDSRFGCYHNEIKSVLLNHQLSPQWPAFKRIIQLRYNILLKNFHEIWIPDEKNIKLSGKLSENSILKDRIKYSGILSRLAKVEAEKKGDYLVILSGPEKNKASFQKVIEEKLKTKNCIYEVIGTKKHTLIHAHELSKKIAEYETVIALCGYTTVMDMYHLQKPCILFPQKGQTEQVYLKHHLLSSFPSWHTLNHSF